MTKSETEVVDMEAVRQDCSVAFENNPLIDGQLPNPKFSWLDRSSVYYPRKSFESMGKHHDWGQAQSETFLLFARVQRGWDGVERIIFDEAQNQYQMPHDLHAFMWSFFAVAMWFCFLHAAFHHPRTKACCVLFLLVNALYLFAQVIHDVLALVESGGEELSETQYGNIETMASDFSQLYCRRRVGSHKICYSG